MQYTLFGELPYNEGVTMRTCKACNEDLPEEEFVRSGYKSDGRPVRAYICITCKAKTINNIRNLRKSSGTPAEMCQCCKDVPAVVLDHCHTSLVFRGWLCQNCNLGIGKLGDTVVGVQKAIDYLKSIDTT